MNSETWVETWQGVSTEGCGTPVSPHDGSLTDSTYTVGDSQITVDGVGAFLGIAKATNGAELGSLEDAVPASRTYDVIEFADDGLSMTIQIGVGNGVWQFKLSKYCLLYTSPSPRD